MAPTPSGFLHEGNVVNLLLTAGWAAAAGGRLLLRVDDFDTGRVRPEYLEDVFDTLDWLQISPDDGPIEPTDFQDHWSMSLHRRRFAAARDRLLDDHPRQVFVCRCSRRALDVQGFCVAACRLRGLPLVPGDTVVRLHVPPGTTVSPRPVSLGRDSPDPGLPDPGSPDPGSPDPNSTDPDSPAASAGVPGSPWAVPPGDHVLWRRDDLPAYQLGSVIADEQLGVTAVLRGADLLDSSALQLHLAALLPAPGFLHADLRHHALLQDPAGHKLSKSAGAQAAPLDRTDALLAHVRERATELGAPIGIAPPP